MKTPITWDATPKTKISWDSAPTQPKTKIQWHETKAAPTPHALDPYIEQYGKQYGVDPNVLQKIGYQETHLGTGANYNPATGHDRDSNQGVGPFQRDLSWKQHLTQQDKSTLDRIAKDPAYATEQAAIQFSGILKGVGGDTRKALSIWNTGSVNATGLSYADSVMGTTLEPLQTMPPGPAFKPKVKPTWEQPTQRGKGKKNTPVQESSLRTALDYLSLPLAYLQAGVSDASVGGGPTKQHPAGALEWGQGPNLRQLQKDLQTGGPSAVAQNDIFPAHGALMRIIQDPHASPQNRATAQWFLKHPFTAGAFDFLQQFENPAYEGKIIGPIMKQAAKLPVVGDAMEIAAHAQNVINEAIVRPITSPVGKAIVKTGIAGLQSIPGETGNAIRSLVDRYTKAGLPQRGGSTYTHAALGAVMYPEYQVGKAEHFFDSLGEGLNQAQAKEVQKLSYQDTATGERLAARDPGVPEPKGVSLEARAHALRQWMMERDVEQNALKIREAHKGEQYDTGTFWPMRQFNEKSPVYKAHELSPEESSGGANDEVTAQSVARRVGARSRYASTLPPSRKKLYSTILNPEVESALHPNYDPFYQLKQHYAPTVRAIANEQVKRDLERLPSIDPETGEQRVGPILGEGERPLYARMPINYARTQPTGEVQVFGQGEKGETVMANYAHRLAKARARNLAAKDPNVLRVAGEEGVDASKLGTRAIVQRNVAPTAARLGEAIKAGKLTARLTQRAQDTLAHRADVELEAQAAKETSKAKITAKTSEDAAAAARAHNLARAQALSPSRIAQFRGRQAEAAKAAGVDARQAERIGDITAKYVRQVATTKTAKAFAQATDRYYKEISGDILKNLRAESTRLPKGYIKESELRIGSPSSRDMAIEEAFGNLFKQGVPAEDRMAAEKLWKSYQVLNSLMRSMIVLFPTVHAINNLGMHYLAEGGNPVEMAQIISGRYVAHAGEEERAARAGALSSHAADGLFGRTGAHATTEAGEHARIISENTHIPKPMVRGYLGLSDMKQRMNDWLFGRVQRDYELSLFHKFTTEGMNDGQAAMRVRESMGRFDEMNDAILNKIFYFVPWMRTVIPFWAKKGVIDPKWWAAPVSGTRTHNQLAGYDDPSKPFQYTYDKDKKGNWVLIPEPIPQRILGMEADVARIPYDLTLPAGNNRNAMLTHDVSSPLNYLAGHENPIVGTLSSFAQLASNDVPPWNPFKAEPGENPAMTFAKKEATNAIAPIGHLDSPALREDPWLALGYPFGVSAYLKPDARHAAFDRNIHSQITKLTNQLAEAKSQTRKATLEAHIMGLQKRLDGGGTKTPIQWNTPKTHIVWSTPKTQIQWDH